jgi:hypothetical protein
VARDVNGVTVANATIAYTASPTSVIEVDGSGRVVGRAPGVGSVTATSGGQTSQPFVITVTLP